MMWAFPNRAEGGVGQADGRPDGWRGEAGVWWAEVKASLAALFWSTVLAIPYHSLGLASEGLPDAIVATAFWIWAERPWQNLTTMVFGSV